MAGKLPSLSSLSPSLFGSTTHAGFKFFSNRAELSWMETPRKMVNNTENSNKKAIQPKIERQITAKFHYVAQLILNKNQRASMKLSSKLFIPNILVDAFETSHQA